MTQKRFVMLTLAIGLCAATASPLSLGGLLGGGGSDRVFDEANYEQALDRYQRMQEQLDVMSEELELKQWLAQQLPVDLGMRYSAAPTPWLHSNPPSDTYGLLGAWTSAVNRGTDPLGAYRLVTEELEPWDLKALNEPGTLVERRKRSFADVELQDGANLHTLELLGSVRANAIDAEEVLYTLEADSFTNVPEFNTEVGLLQKNLASGVLAVRGQQDLQKLLVAQIEMQLSESKSRRDTLAREVTIESRYRGNAEIVHDRFLRGLGNSLQEFRYR